jgi:putative membrane protein insertion efficiency factor
MIKKIALLFLRVYKQVLSPFLPRACIYIPTCSEYAGLAIEKFGMLKGSFLAVKRVLRCNPLYTGGMDPVP